MKMILLKDLQRKNKIEINEIIQPEFNSSNRLRKLGNQIYE